jgi:RNA polymerase sigma factor (TIGR02999 family)
MNDVAKPHEADEWLRVLYGELRELAALHLRRSASPGNATLQPTALVHEVYLKLAGGETPGLRGRSHFLALASTAMKQVLTDHVRRRMRQKRGGERERITLLGVPATGAEQELELIVFLDLIERFASQDPRAAKVVELRYFGGLAEKEIAEELGVSARTVSHDWAMARAWLSREMLQDR